ncbi:ComEA family DNA-binding protein [Arthrobacter sp. MDT2-2]
MQWGVARPAALVFLWVALAIGAALFLVRSSEPSAAAVSVQLDARSSNGEEPGTGPPDASRSVGPDAVGPDAVGPGAGDGGSGGSGGADADATGPDAGGSSSGAAPGGRQQGHVQARVGDASEGSSEGSSAGTPAPAGGAGQRTILVYVTGAVASPGVVTIPSDARLFEVLEKAGGALPEADLDGINLAAAPSDGQHIHLLAVGEEPRADQDVPDATAAPPGVEVDASGGTPDSSGAGPGGVIDINTATLAEIESLPRVGPVIGQRIIDWREENGPFGQPADIDAVPGIGPGMLEGILPRIVVR